jgi:hypothetical protein
VLALPEREGDPCRFQYSFIPRKLLLCGRKTVSRYAAIRCVKKRDSAIIHFIQSMN